MRCLAVPHFVSNGVLWSRRTGETISTEVSRKWGGGYMRERGSSLAIIWVKVVRGAASVIVAGTSVLQGRVRCLVCAYWETFEGKWLWLRCERSATERKVTAVFKLSHKKQHWNGCSLGDFEKFWFLGYNTVQPVKSQATFRSNISHPSSGSQNRPSNKPELKQNNRWIWADCTALYPRRWQSSQPPKCEPGTLHADLREFKVNIKN
jgi:hypothetical protein